MTVPVEVWGEAFHELEDAERHIGTLVARAARLEADNSAKRLRTLELGLRAIKDAVEACDVPDWLAEQVEP